MTECWKHCWNLLYYLLWVWVFYCIVICSKHGKTVTLSITIFITKIKFFISQCIPWLWLCASKQNVWGGERAWGREEGGSGCRSRDDILDITVKSWCAKVSEGHTEGSWKQEWKRVGVCVFVRSDSLSADCRRWAARCVAAAVAVRCSAGTKRQRGRVGGEKCFVISAFSMAQFKSSRKLKPQHFELRYHFALTTCCCGAATFPFQRAATADSSRI